MSRRSLIRLIAVLAVAAIAVPALAGIAVAKDSKDSKATFKATLDLSSAATLGGTALKPGTYSLVADESKVTLKLGSKVVAEAPVQWKDADKKEFATNVVLEGKSIKEIRFGGKTRYLIVQ
ncbi:MAG: hypothetical protein WBC04_25825 [Candidatus Acidiferrales bacterium]